METKNALKNNAITTVVPKAIFSFTTLRFYHEFEPQIVVIFVDGIAFLLSEFFFVFDFHLDEITHVVLHKPRNFVVLECSMDFGDDVAILKCPLQFDRRPGTTLHFLDMKQYFY